MQINVTIVVRVCLLVLLILLSSGSVRADEVPCLDGTEFNWEACNSDERLSVALGVWLHHKLHDRYDPVPIHSALLGYGFDQAEIKTLPIDVIGARAILKTVRPPDSDSERYAWLSYRNSECLNAKDAVVKDMIVMQALDGKGEGRNAEADSPECVKSVDADTASAEEKITFGADDEVKVSYRRDKLNRTQFEILKKGRSTDPLVSDQYESRIFSVGTTIEGWRRVLPKMTPEVDYEVVIPPSQAYGQRGVEGSVEPGEYLRFVMRLHCDSQPSEKFEECQ